MYTVSRWWSRDEPWYQSMEADRVTTLSPSRALIGMNVTSDTSSRLANAVNSAQMAS